MVTDDDDVVVDDDDVVVDDDDVVTDDDDVVTDDDDVVTDDDDVVVDDDDVVTDDDDSVADDDDSAAAGPDCSVGFLVACEIGHEAGNNAGAGSTQVVDEYSCNPGLDQSGPELAYIFTPTFDGDVTVTLTGLTEDLNLFLLEDDGSDACQPDTCVQSSIEPNTDDESITFSAAEGSTYYLVVDGFEGAIGDYDLTIDCPACEDDITLDCDTFTEDSWNNGSAGSTNTIEAYNCSIPGHTGPEYVYDFVAPVDGDYSFVLTGLTADLDLFVLDGAGDCDASSCTASSTEPDTDDESVTVTLSAGEAIYLSVDGWAGAESDYDLSMTCPDGLCAETAPNGPLSCTNSFDSGDTTSADSTMADYSCTSWNESGPELVYSFVPTLSGDYTFELSNLNGGDLDVLLLEADASTGACSADNCLAAGNTAVTSALTAGTTYFVVVDGFLGDSGTYDLTLTCPSCSQDYPLNCTLNASDDWSTAFGQNLYEEYDLGTGPISGWTGNEYVYEFLAAADGDVTLDLDIDDDATVDLDLLVLPPDLTGSCDPDAVTESSTQPSGDETVTFAVIAGETWYIVVDGWNGDQGDYVLSATCI